MEPTPSLTTGSTSCSPPSRSSVRTTTARTTLVSAQWLLLSPSFSVVVQAIAAARIPRLHAMRAAHSLGVLPAQTPRLRPSQRANSRLAIRAAPCSRSHRDPTHRKSALPSILSSSSRRSFCTTESFSTRLPSPMKYLCVRLSVLSRPSAAKASSSLPAIPTRFGCSLPMRRCNAIVLRWVGIARPPILS